MARSTAVGKAAIAAVNEALSGAGAPGDAEEPGETEGGQGSFLRARMANEVIRGQTAKVRLQKMKGDLLDRARAMGTVLDVVLREHYA